MSRLLLAALLFPAAILARQAGGPPGELPATAVARLSSGLEAARAHARHVWRDTPPLNEDGTVNAYVEIARGDRRKWELDLARNARAIDRMMPRDLAYPVNYGIVPQTISYDGDPFDVLVLGPPIEGGRLVRGTIVGLMQMEDEKGLDSKVVVTPLTRDGKPRYALTAAEQQRIGDYFRRYKQHEAGKGAFSNVPGWSSVADGLAFVRTTHAFFLECRRTANAACRVKQ